MRNHEFFDPSIPQIQKRHVSRPSFGVRSYKVAAVGEFVPGKDSGLECVLKLTQDDGSGGSDFLVRASSKNKLQTIVSNVQTIAEHEVKAKRAYELGYRKNGKEYILLANKLREKAQSHGVSIPLREWDPPEGGGIIAWQEDLF